MTNRNKKTGIATILFATVLLSAIGMSSCEGRKMSNMEPTGDTVEVIVDSINN